MGDRSREAGAEGGSVTRGGGDRPGAPAMPAWSRLAGELLAAYAQVFFAQGLRAGLLVAAATFTRRSSEPAAWAAFWVAAGLRRLLRLDAARAERGHYGYNALLAGLAVGAFVGARARRRPCWRCWWRWARPRPAAAPRRAGDRARRRAAATRAQLAVRGRGLAGAARRRGSRGGNDGGRTQEDDDGAAGAAVARPVSLGARSPCSSRRPPAAWCWGSQPLAWSIIAATAVAGGVRGVRASCRPGHGAPGGALPLGAR